METEQAIDEIIRIGEALIPDDIRESFYAAWNAHREYWESQGETADSEDFRTGYIAGWKHGRTITAEITLVSLKDICQCGHERGAHYKNFTKCGIKYCRCYSFEDAH